MQRRYHCTGFAPDLHCWVAGNIGNSEKTRRWKDHIAHKDHFRHQYVFQINNRVTAIAGTQALVMSN